MPPTETLTKTERDFLNAYVYEATHEPFGGPATNDLHRRGIHYSDLNWLLTAFNWELCAQGIPPLGQQNPSPPSSPWNDLAHAEHRNQQLREECECQITQPSSGQPAMPARRTAEEATRIVSQDG
jgi:hypothetical protein